LLYARETAIKYIPSRVPISINIFVPARAVTGQCSAVTFFVLVIPSFRSHRFDVIASSFSDWFRSVAVRHVPGSAAPATVLPLRRLLSARSSSVCH
jgi:hypothetical protein